MLTVDNIETYGWEAAIRGMRNPMNSWDKADSLIIDDATMWHDIHGNYEQGIVDGCPRYGNIMLGQNDMQLMRSLCNGGPVHAKFRRMLNVAMDITAPLYWWKEFDTYKVGTVANSCSTMHKVHAKKFVMDDFSTEHLSIPSLNILGHVIKCMNDYREEYLKDGDKHNWWQMIQLLPTSYNQKRTVQMNYEVLARIYTDRKNHKLDEWHTLCHVIEELPYSWIITGVQNG